MTLTIKQFSTFSVTNTAIRQQILCYCDSKISLKSRSNPGQIGIFTGTGTGIKCLIPVSAGSRYRDHGRFLGAVDAESHNLSNPASFRIIYHFPHNFAYFDIFRRISQNSCMSAHFRIILSIRTNLISQKFGIFCNIATGKCGIFCDITTWKCGIFCDISTSKNGILCDITTWKCGIFCDITLTF